MKKNPDPKWRCQGCGAIVRGSTCTPVIDKTDKMSITTMLCPKCVAYKE